MRTETNGVIRCVLYNKDGTVDYVLDDTKLDEVIASFLNKANTERGKSKALYLSSSDDSKDVLGLLVILCWYDWWNGDRIEYNFEVKDNGYRETNQKIQ